MEDRQVLLDRLRGLAAHADRVLSVLPEQALGARGEDGWPFRDLLIHLSDFLLVQNMRLRRLVAEDHPVMQAVDQDKWLRGLSSHKRSPELASAMIGGLLASAIEIVDLAEERVFDRRAYHPVRGDMTFSGVIESLLDRSAQLIEQLESVAKSG